MSYEDETAIDFRPILLKLAFILLLIDCFAMLIISGHIKKLKFIIPLLFLFLTPVDAQIKGSDETRLVFVKTGKANIDSVTLSGLKSLTRFISNRTTLEPQEPIGIDLERDELNIHPLLYFVVTDDAPMLSVTAKIKLEQFLKGGGMLLLDTRDAHLGATAPNPAVRRVLLGLDIPEMSPMPKDHVLGRTYYLLDSIVGRYANGTTWVESLSLANDDERPVKASDNVTPIIITSNDLAGAWAVDEGGKALLPVDGVRQREMAYRAGVNIVFYALTGNYKADQVHAPALLERLGRKK